MDDNEHGTHVSGTIAGRGNGGPPVLRRQPPKATLIAVKVLDADGAGRLSDIVKGVDWATKARADVINLSLGGLMGSPALERAVERALAAGVVVVAAAGNSGPSPDTVGLPGGYPGVIAVAASDENDRVAAFSSRGDQIAFIAPGVNIRSTIPGGGYKALSASERRWPRRTWRAWPPSPSSAAPKARRAWPGPSRPRRRGCARPPRAWLRPPKARA